ncbi:MAG: glutathionylspermidine synthase family protein [Gammaproteobacteria bacterium]|nr:glutathionylspermidine synthase family protein [Gammaproteobacteria bacterium]
MKRLSIKPREKWQDTVSNLGLTYHSDDNKPYWDESVCYSFEESEIAYIEKSANRLHQLCLEAVDYIIAKKCYDKFNLPESAISLIESSWQADKFYLYGRFDFLYDQNNRLKLLEYNADTPTALYEASVVQWQWLSECYPEQDQFNFIHEQLILQWKKLKTHSHDMHFVCVTDSEEDLLTTEYLSDLFLQAKKTISNININVLDVSSIGWNGYGFTDLNNHYIKMLFKLYPWEWLVHEEFSQYIDLKTTQWIEPPWKMLLSNKALLPILWKLFPGHENLLPAYDSLSEAVHKNGNNKIVKKPIFGREGANISIIDPSSNKIILEEPGPYDKDGFIYQHYCSCNYEEYYPILGVWMVGDVAAGMGVRESNQAITTNMSRFVPHYSKV